MLRLAPLGLGQQPDAAHQIHVFPAPMQAFQLTGAGVEHQGQRSSSDPIPILGQRVEQSPRLPGRKGLLAGSGFLQAVDAGAGVLVQVVEDDGPAEHCRQQGQVAVHAGRAVRLAQLSQVGFDMPTSDRRQLQVREGWQQPTPQFAGVVSMAAFVLTAVGQVGLSKLAEGQVDLLFLLPRIDALLDLGTVRQGQLAGIGDAQRRVGAQADRPLAAGQHETKPEGLAAAGHRQA